MSGVTMQDGVAHEFEAEQALFLACLDADDAGRARLLDAAPAPLAGRVRRLLGLHERAEAGGLDLDLELADSAIGGDSIGPYRLLERIGEGGMGEVFLALQDEPVRRLVALKLIRPGYTSREVLARFAAERQALARMSHASIARILDAGELPSGRPFFAMEYVAGEPITRYCRERRLPLSQRIALFARVCHAVQHAHEKGVIHRDIKPSNILVAEIDGRPHPVLIDFGVAKAIGEPLTDRTLQTRLGTFMGTPDYMSPEQAQGGIDEIDTRSDLWSLGAVLYELVAGSTPYRFAEREAGPAAVQAALAGDDAPRPSARVREAGDAGHADACGMAGPAALARELEDELDWIVLHALERAPSRRYSSASALADDLWRYLRDEPVQARPPSFLYTFGKLVRRHAVAATLATTGSAALLAIAVMMGFHARALRVERDRTLLEANRSAEVTRFVTELFEIAEPVTGSGPQTTARELLETAATRLRERPVDDPLIQSELELATGRLFAILGERGRARALYESAVALRERSGASDVDLGEAKYWLGELMRMGGEHDAALPLLGEARDLVWRSPDSDPDQRALVALEWAELVRWRGDEAESRRVVEEVLRDLERHQRTATPRYGCALNVLARLQRGAGQLHEAEASLRRAIELDPPATQERGCRWTAYTVLAFVLSDMGRFDEAEATQRQALEAFRREVGERHPDTLGRMADLGTILSKAGKYAEAIAVLEASSRGMSEVLGPESPSTLVGRVNLAAARLHVGQSALAATELADLRERCSRVLGARHGTTGLAIYHLAEASRQTGRVAEAEAQAREAVDIFRERYGGQAPWTIRAQARLAGILADVDRRDEAMEIMRAAIHAAETTFGADHAETGSLREFLAGL